MKTLVIIPCYNEQDNILRVIDDIQKHPVEGMDYVVVNDCSKDNSPQILDDHHINHIDLPVNLGLAGAMQTGYKYAYENDYDIAIQFDGDGQHRAEYLGDLIKEIENGADIAIGSRFVTEKKNWSARMMGSRVITFIIKLTTGFTLNDPTSGMRAINKPLIKNFATLINQRPEPDTVAYYIKKGKKMKEIQVKIDDRIAGVSYLSGIMSSVTYMLKVVIAILFFN